MENQGIMDFEVAMSKVSAVCLTTLRKEDPLAANKALEELTAKAQAVSLKTAWSATQIADKMSFLGMKGMHYKDIITSFD